MNYSQTIKNMSITQKAVISLIVGLILGGMLLTRTILQVRASPDSVRFQQGTYYVNEYAGTVTITVTLDFTPTDDVTVDYTTSNGTAVDCNDYDAASGQLTFASGETSQTFSVVINDDTDIESDESVELTLSNPNGTSLGTPNSATLVILDDDAAPTVQFGAQSFIVGESGGEAMALVTLSRPLTQTVEVDYTTTNDGAADSGIDYVPISGTLTFAPGQTSASFKVTILDDAWLEGKETVDLDLFAPTNASLGSPDSVFLNIFDESVSPGTGEPLIFFNSGSYVVDESAQRATVVAALSVSSTQTIEVDYSTRDSLATDDGDYAATDGTLTFAPGQTLITFTVPISDDALFEGNESFWVDLSNPSNAELEETRKSTSLAIVDDEIELTVKLDTDTYSIAEDGGSVTLGATLSADYGQPVTVTYSTSDDSAVSPADYTAATSQEVIFAPCQPHQTFSIPIVDDGFDEPDETFVTRIEDVTPSPEVKLAHPDAADVTIVDDDIPMVQFDRSIYSVSEGVSPATVVATLNPTSTWQTVVVDYDTSDGTATDSDDYLRSSGTLTFTPGQTSHTFEVSILDDMLDEYDEAAQLHLTNVRSDMMDDAVITGTNPAPLVIQDDDPLPDVQFSQADYEVAEDGGTALITVTLDVPSGRPVTVTYDTVDGSAHAGQDYTDASGTLHFAPGQTTQIFTVPIDDDGLYEVDETVELHLSTADNATIAAPNPATLTILDNDPPPTVQFSGSTYSVGESEGTALITVTLDAPSGLTATVDYATADGTATAPGDYQSTSDAVALPPGETSVTFTVSIVSDTTGETNETVTLALSQPDRATLGTPDTATLTIIDDDVPEVQFDRTAYSADEGTGTVTIEAILSKTYAQSVAVDYATSDGTATDPDDYRAASGSLTFSPGQTHQQFTVDVIDDALYEGDETATITLSDPTRATIAGTNPVTLSILDNDPLPRVHYGSSNYRVEESDSVASVTVALDTPSGRAVTVTYGTGDDTATAGDDYESSSGELTFAPGESQKTFDIRILEDAVDEDVETISLSLSSAVNAVIDGANPASLQITDNDQPAVTLGDNTYHVNEDVGSVSIPVTLTIPSWHTVTVRYAAEDDTAMAPADYITTTGQLTFSPGQTAESFSVPIVDDALNEPDETMRLTLSDAISATLGASPTATLTIEDNDELPTVQFKQGHYEINETDGVARVVVELNKSHMQTITVDCAVDDDTAIAGRDYTTTIKSLTFPPGETRRAFNVTIIDDDDFERDESVSVKLCCPVNATLGSPEQATINILSHDPAYVFLPLVLKNYPRPRVRFETATYAVTEDSTTATVKVSLDRAANTTVTVTYAASDGTATDGADYTATNGTLTFAPGEVSRSFDVTIQEDELDERDETVALRLSEAVNADLGTPQRATLTIVDDDEPPTVRFSSSTYSVTENLGTTVVTATLDAPSGRVVAVDYTTNDDTAVAGDDYTAISGTLTFVPGTTHRTFVVEIIDDAHPEPDKTIALRLSNASNAYLGTPNPADLVILDDDIPSVRFSQASYSQEEGDTAITIQVTLSDYSWQPVEVDYATADGTASAGSDYASAQGTLTFEPGEIGQTFTVDILEDALDEYDETLTLRLSNPLHAELGTPNPVDLTIVDDDPLPEVRFDASRYREREGTGLVTVVATLNAPSGRTVQVNYATEDGTAIAGQDYAGTNGTLTFTPGQTRQTFTVAVNDDAVDERDEETVTLRLSTPVNAALGDPNPITLTIVDNDQPPNVLFNAADYTIDEGDGTAIATVMLSAASGRSVTVNYLTEDGTAIAGQDYDAVSGQLTFDPGETSQTFAIPITDDDADEADETIALKLDNAVNASIGDPGQATLSILDDDVPIVQFSASSYNVGEGAGEATIAVTLDIPSWQAVTVDYATGDGTAMAGSDYAASSGSLTFNPGETNRTFNVAITDDAIDEPSETIALRLSNPVNLSLGTRDESTLTIGDNNDPSPTVQFSASSYPVDETINVATITATLSAASGWTVNVDYATSDGTARVGDGDYEATTGTLAFAPGQTQQTFEVIVLDDRLDEADETLNLALDTPSHATLGTPNQSTMVIVDDDPIPDLVGSFSLEPDKLTFAAGEPVTITVVITNQGSIAASPFWADFFINPSAPPERANTIWSDYCSLDPCLGISWYVATGLEPGQSIKLTSTYGSYADGYTVWPGYFVNGTTDLYLYVDSWNPGVPTGAVAESYEDNNRAELHGLEVTGASGAQSVTSLCVGPPPRPTHLTE